MFRFCPRRRRTPTRTRVGLANASPGKQVLGTVPVEPDGSAFFRAPAGIPLSFQALDERGMAIQTMRSLTYLQPGEQTSCVGCHEHRTTAPVSGGVGLAALREPSSIAPAPDGSKPFSYPILVQPVLDSKCVSCHGGEKIEGGIDLTGTPEGQFSRSYNALARLVPFSSWQGTPQANHEPLTHPDQFGARASTLTPPPPRRSRRRPTLGRRVGTPHHLDGRPTPSSTGRSIRKIRSDSNAVNESRGRRWSNQCWRQRCDLGVPLAACQPVTTAYDQIDPNFEP